MISGAGSAFGQIRVLDGGFGLIDFYPVALDLVKAAQQGVIGTGLDERLAEPAIGGIRDVVMRHLPRKHREIEPYL